MANPTLTPQSRPALFREAANTMPPKREHFLDYFPNTRSRYGGYIREEIFGDKMTEVINECVKDTGSLNQYNRMPKQINSDEFSARMYYQNIKEKILHRVYGTEWRTPNEMRMSEEMFAQSDAYFQAVIKDVAMFGAGKLVDKTAEKAQKVITSQAVKRGLFTQKNVDTFNTTLNKGADFLGEKITPKGLIEDGAERIAGMIRKKEEKYETISFTDTSALYDACGVKPSEMGLIATNTLATGVDIITDIHPKFKKAKLVAQAGLNVFTGIQVRGAAEQVKAIEDQSNAAERNFNQQLKQTIHDDVSALSPEEIKNLIDIIGLTESTK